MKEQDYGFEITGGFLVEGDFKKELSWDGRTVGFKLPDGRTVRLAAALEVESADGSDCEYITSEKQMDELGFRCLDYERLEFEEADDE